MCNVHNSYAKITNFGLPKILGISCLNLNIQPLLKRNDSGMQYTIHAYANKISVQFLVNRVWRLNGAGLAFLRIHHRIQNLDGPNSVGHIVNPHDVSAV